MAPLQIGPILARRYSVAWGPPILIVLTVEVTAADLLEIARAGHSDPVGESKRRLIRIRMGQSS
jgi:hypothetical protein